MIGRIIKSTDFDSKLFVSEFTKNHNTKEIKINTYKKSFDDYILDLYKKILILNKYRKIDQNIISFGNSFNISSKKNIDIPFYIPDKFEVKKITIYFDLNKFQYNKIKSKLIEINKKTTYNDNNHDFTFLSNTFVQEPPLDNEGYPDLTYNNWKFLFLSPVKIKEKDNFLNSSGAGSGQSFGVDTYEETQTSDYYNWTVKHGLSEEPQIDILRRYFEEEGKELDPENQFHTHKYPFASSKHKHYLQPTAHYHKYQISPHTHTYPAHKHSFTTPEHSHDIDFSHSHDIENDFYQSSTIGNVTIKINNNLIVDKKQNGESEFSQYIQNGLNTINFSCSDKAFLIFTITASGRIQI